MKYLVLGRAGSGKSSVAHELKDRGYSAFDADSITGLARWEDATTAQPITPQDITYVDSSKIHWNWQNEKISQLLESEMDLFLCGGADNDLSFIKLFDRAFILDVAPQIQAERLKSPQREQENSYATHPDMIPIVLTEQLELLKSATELGAVAINANQPIKKVVDDILSHIHDN
jgi:adenylate kinase family enzyme